MEKTKSIISWGQLIIIVGILFLFLYGIASSEISKSSEKALPVVGYTISGSTITNYDGDETVLNIPSSYSLGPTTNKSGNITFKNRSQALAFLQENYATGASGYYDFYQEIYSRTYPWYYEYSIDIPSYVMGNDYTITSISSYAFSNNTTIEKIIIPSSIESIDNFAFQYCTNLQEIEFNEGLTFIGDSAFWECGIRELNLPTSLETIYPYAFFWCHNLEKVTIPKNVKDITLGTFNGCENLTTVTILSEYEMEIWSTEAYQIFSRCPKLQSIYIPAKMLSYYQNTEPWNLYLDKFKIM